MINSTTATLSQGILTPSVFPITVPGEWTPEPRTVYTPFKQKFLNGLIDFTGHLMDECQISGVQLLAFAPDTVGYGLKPIEKPQYRGDAPVPPLLMDFRLDRNSATVGISHPTKNELTTDKWVEDALAADPRALKEVLLKKMLQLDNVNDFIFRGCAIRSPEDRQENLRRYKAHQYQLLKVTPVAVQTAPLNRMPPLQGTRFRVERPQK